MEFLPDLKLNDSTGKTIADRAEESLDKVFTAAAAGKSFSTIKNEFSADTAVQKTAKEQYQQLCDAYLNSDTNTWKLESVVTLENEKWVMGSDFLTKIGHEA